MTCSSLHAYEAPFGGKLAPCQSLKNLAMISLQTSMEWPYGYITLLFQIMHSKYQKKYISRTRLLNTCHYINSFGPAFFAHNCNLCFNGDK